MRQTPGSGRGIEVVREDRRVYVRMHGPEYLSNEKVLCRAIIREEELERTVRELERSASELERERDGARDAAYVREDAYGELEELSTSISRRNPLWRTGDCHRRQHTVHRK